MVKPPQRMSSWSRKCEFGLRLSYTACCAGKKAAKSRRMSFHLRIALALFLLVAPLSGLRRAKAQTSAAAILAGVDSVDAEINLTWDARITNHTENETRLRL